MRVCLAVALAFAIRRILPAAAFGYAAYAFAVTVRLDAAAPVVGVLSGMLAFLELVKGGGQ